MGVSPPSSSSRLSGSHTGDEFSEQSGDIAAVDLVGQEQGAAAGLTGKLGEFQQDTGPWSDLEKRMAVGGGRHPQNEFLIGIALMDGGPDGPGMPRLGRVHRGDHGCLGGAVLQGILEGPQRAVPFEQTLDLLHEKGLSGAGRAIQKDIVLPQQGQIEIEGLGRGCSQHPTAPLVGEQEILQVLRQIIKFPGQDQPSVILAGICFQEDQKALV